MLNTLNPFLQEAWDKVWFSKSDFHSRGRNSNDS